MADFLETLRGYAKGYNEAIFKPVDPNRVAPPPVPVLSEQEQVANDLNQLDAALTTPGASFATNLSRTRDNSLTRNNKMFKDYDQMGALGFERAYGTEALQKMQQLGSRMREVNQLEDSTRSIPDHAQDALVSGVNGAIQGAAGISEFVLRVGPFSKVPYVGEKLIDLNGYLSNKVNETANYMHTDGWKDKAYVAAQRAELDAVENRAKFKADLASDGLMFAHLRDLGRGAFDGVKRFWEDPTQLEDGVSAAVGSMLVGGPAAKLLNVAAKGATKIAAPILNNVVKTLAEKTIEKVAFPTTIGMMEGGSAAMQASQEIMATPEAELRKNEEYKYMLSTGTTPKDARREMADRGAKTAAMIAFPVGALSGTLVKGFETNPFARTSVKGILKNMANEGLEETPQGIAGQVGVNLAKKVTVDPNQNMTEDVGDQGVQSLVVGSLAPLTTQGPSLAAREAAKAAVKVAAAPFKYAYRKAAESFDRQTAAAAKESDVSEENASITIDLQANKATDVADNLSKAAEASADKDPGTSTFINNVKNALTLTDTETDHLPPVVKETVAKKGTPTNKFDAVKAAATVANDETASESDRASAATFILKNVSQNDDTLTENMPKFLKEADTNGDLFKSFSDLSDAIRAMGQVPAVKKAIKWARESMKMPDQDLTNVDLKSDDGAKIIKNAVDMATVAPDAVNPKVINDILLQSAKLGGVLTKEQKQILLNSLHTTDAPNHLYNEPVVEEAAAPPTPNTGETASAPAGEAVAPKVYARPSMDFVARDISTGGEVNSEKKSLRDHVVGINMALQSGNVAQVKARVLHLSKFAQSQVNKVKAINESIIAGDGKDRPYKALSPNGKFYTPEKGYGYRADKPGSEKFARTVHGEAFAMAQMVNNIIRDNDLKLPLLAVPKLKLDATPTKAAVVSTVTPEMAAGMKPERLQKYLSALKTRASKRDLTPEEKAIQDVVTSELKKREEATAKTGPVKLSVSPTGSNKNHLDKDQAKADKANKFIGRGSDNSSTNTYSKDFGDKANTGEYTADDVVFISAEGNRKDRVNPDFAEIQKAVDAGAKLITDDAKGRDGKYNVGERQVAEYLTKNGYEESAPGEWTKAKANSAIDEIVEKVKSSYEGKLPEGWSLEINGSDSTKERVALAGAMISKKTIMLNIDKIVVDFEAGLKYISGFEGQTSAQKLEVFKNIDAQAFRDFILSKDVYTYIDFIVAHEIAHVEQANRGEVYSPNGLMDPVNIALEREANAAGFKAIGFKPKDDQGVFTNVWQASGENAELSNLAIRPFTYRGNKFFSVEHAYQSWKSGNFDKATYDKYDGDKPRKIRGKAANTTDGYNIKLMEKLMMASFEQNPDAAKALLNTGNTRITHTQDKGIWGKQFPRILTKIRNKLKSGPQVLDNLTNPIKPTERKSVKSVAKTTIEEITDQEMSDLMGDTQDNVDPISTQDAFPDLVAPKGRNKFWEAFSFRKKSGSRLSSIEHPLVHLYRLFNKSNAKSEIQQLMGDKKIDYAVNEDDLVNFRKLLALGGKAIAVMNDHLRDAIVPAKGNQSSIAERMKNGDDAPLSYVRLRALSLVEGLEGTPAYNKQLIETAMVAAIDWLLNTSESEEKIDVEKLAKVLGISEFEAESYIYRFNSGISVDMAVKALSANIQKFWDTKTNPKARKAYTDGIPEHVAKEILTALAEVGLVKLDKIEVQSNNKGETSTKGYGRVVFNERSENITKMFEDLSGAETFLGDVSLIDNENATYTFGTPPKEVDKTVLHNPLLKLSSMAMRALKNVQNTPYSVSLETFHMVTSMGREAFVSMRSGHRYNDGDLDKDYTETPYNKGDWESIRGKQLSYVQSYDNVMKMVKAAKRHADENGIPITDVKIHFRHSMTSAGRMQMLGRSAPQTDKYAREVFLPTKSTINVKNQKSSGFVPLMKTIGQGIGLKTEQLTGHAVAKQVMSRMAKPDGDLYPLVQLAREWLIQRKDNPRVNMPPGFQELLEATEALSLHGYSSVIAMAQYLNGMADGSDMTKFTTTNYLEADGKTNGPANAIATLSMGLITVERLQALSRVGAFIGKSGTTLNEYFKKDPVDLYTAVAKDLAVNMAALKKFIRSYSNVELIQHHDRFSRVLSALNIDVNIIDGELVIKRGVTKNPVTVTIYGAGPDGISKKIANELIKELYSQISNNIGSKNDLKAILNTVSEDGKSNFHDDLRSMLYQLVDLESGNLSDDPKFDMKLGKDFVVSEKAYENLWKNIRQYMTNPMVASIEKNVTSHTSKATKLIQEATNIQSIFLKHMFISELTKEIARMQSDPEKYGYSGGDFVSAEQLNAIMAKLEVYAPSMSTGTQSYMISGGEKSGLFTKVIVMIDGKPVTVTMPETFSRTMNGELKTPAMATGPVVAGVKALSIINIGSGDGQMMLNFMTQYSDASGRVLHVYDGLNMPADMIEDYSRKINESVFRTWTTDGNPMSAVYDMFDRFVNADPATEMFGKETPQKVIKDMLYEISTAYTREYGQGNRVNLNADEVYNYIDEIHKVLFMAMVDTNTTRKLYAEMPFTVDQMAGGEAPHVNEGTIKIPKNASAKKIVEIMRARYKVLYELEMKEALLKSTSKKVAPATTRTAEEEAPSVWTERPSGVEKEDPQFVKAIEDISVQDGDGIRMIQGAGIEMLIPLLVKSGNKIQAEMAKAAIALLKSSGYKIVFGSPEELDAWEQKNNEDRFVENTTGYFGKIDPVSKIILIANTTPETIVHELIHAATIDKVRNHFSEDSTLSDADTESVKKIFSLMTEWLTNSDSDEEWSGYGAQEMAKNAIYGYLKDGKDAEAVNEFMAWVLSNNKLADRAASMKSESFISKIIARALKAFKHLIWGEKFPQSGESVLSNLRFYTSILMATPTDTDKAKADYAGMAMYQSVDFGINDRIANVRVKLDKRLVAFINGNPKDPKSIANKVFRENEAGKNLEAATDIAKSFAQFFTGLNTVQGFTTFSMIQMALMTDIELNTNSLGRIEEVYADVMDRLKIEDFRTNEDPNDDDDISKATEKYNMLQGVYITRTDKRGRSSLMSSFLALATVDDEFRAILSKMEKPKAENSVTKTFDERLESLMDKGIDRVAAYYSGEKTGDVSIQDTLDNLTVAMIDNIGDQRTQIEKSTDSFLDFVDDKASELIQNTSAAVAEKAADVARKSTSLVVKSGAVLVNVVATIVNEQKSEAAMQGFVQAMNKKKGFHALKEFTNDVISQTADNTHVVALVSLFKSTIQQVRQQFREELPKILEGKFSKALTKEQWTSMTKVIGKTDFAALVDQYGLAGAVDLLLDFKKMTSAIKTAENNIRKLDPRRFNEIQNKTKQLANYLNTGIYGEHLLSNAHSVAHLNGLPMWRSKVHPDLIKEVDKLATLYALESLSSHDHQALEDLIVNEREGVEFVTSYLVGMRKVELEKLKGNDVALFNHFKGSLPSEYQQGGSIVLIDEADSLKYIKQGYKKVGEYKGSAADRTRNPKGYYFSPVSSLAPFNQGTMQTVHNTVSGVDPNTGYTVGKLNGGRIRGNAAKLATQISRQKPSGTAVARGAIKSDEHLKPIFDKKGYIVAYERTADPKYELLLNKQTDLGQIIGAWHGRLVEELQAKSANQVQIDRLYKKWLEDVKAGRSKEYVNVANLNKKFHDPILTEAVGLLSKETMDYAQEVFGEGEFWVRDDVALDVFGARQASVGDMFTGNTRWSKAVTSKFETIAIGMFGFKAMPAAVGIERNVQEFVGAAKNNIVVKSTVVVVANMVSNMQHLVNRGVPVREVFGGVPRKTVEINNYIKSRHKITLLEAELLSAKSKNDIVATQHYTNQIQSIEDGQRRMSIWPLIEAGEFSAISNGQVTSEDLALADGKWSSWLERKIDALPAPYRQTVRQGLITKDTAIFKGLSRATQYGDFIAKAILYDHEMKKPDAESNSVISGMGDVFANYNRPIGRTRQYLESIGLLWFYSYKLRIMKEAAYTLRHHPFRSLIMMAMPFSAGDPTTDNLVSLAWKSKLGFSIGPGMGIGSFGLNPWINFTGWLFK